MTREKSQHFLLVYGSETGQAQAIAEEIAERAQKHGLIADVHCFSKTEKEFWLDREKVAVIVSSTTGDGDPPETVRKFYRRIKKNTLPKDHLKNLNYALLGLGDTNYSNFCNGGRLLDNRFEELGAQRFYECGWADDGTGLEVVVEPWIDGLWEPLKKQLEKSASVVDCNGTDNSADASPDNDTRLPKTMDTGQNSTEQTSSNTSLSTTRAMGDNSLKKSDSSKSESQLNAEKSSVSGSSQNTSDGLSISDRTTGEVTNGVAVMNKSESQVCDSEETEAVVESLTCSVPPLCDIEVTIPLLQAAFLRIQFQPDLFLDTSALPLHNGCPFPTAKSDLGMANITMATRLTREDSVKTALKLELDITANGWSYEPGDSFSIVCPNTDSEVTWLLQRLHLLEKADIPLTIHVIEGTKKKNAKVPEHIPTPCTLRHALVHCCEIRTVPKKAFLRTLVEHTSNLREKCRLQELCSKQGAAAYTQFIREPSITLLDLLEAFPSCNPTLETLLEHLPRMRPRPYSAASSIKAHPNKMHFVFNIIEIPSGSGRSQERLGVCTSWLNQLTQSLQGSGNGAGEGLEKLTLEPKEEIAIPIYKRINHNFHLPSDPSIPIMMVGPGTGVAPFIGFLEERQCLRQSGSVTGEAWLFFGCRHKERDYLFREDLENFVKDGTLSHLKTSFSRDARQEDEPKYVQDNIKTCSKELVTLICDNSAHVFVCGDARFMAKNVTEAFVEILGQEKGMNPKDAAAFIMQMRLQKRYLEDVWA